MINGERIFRNCTTARQAFTVPVVIAFIVLLSCSTSQNKTDPACPDSKTDPVAFVIDSNGTFCGTDTFIIKTAGIPDMKDKSGDITARKKHSRKNAILNAQYSIMQYMRDLREKEKRETDKYSEIHITGIDPWYKELVELVKSGNVICESYDNEQNCTILYTVTKNNLQQWIKADLN